MTARLNSIERGQAALDALHATQAPSGGAIRHPSAGNAAMGALSRSKVILECGSDIAPEAISWIWRGWLAEGKAHILAGPPGVGKTTLVIAIIAAITKGGFLPSGDRAEKRRVLIWSGEDDPKDTLIPRLIACGADLAMVSFIKGVTDDHGFRPFDPASDVVLLMDRLTELGDTGLILIDPIVSAVAADSNKNAEVRRALQPLVDFAAANRCAVLGISHFSKGTAGRDPLERVTGSLAFGAVARIVMVAVKVKDEQSGDSWRLLARAKSNIGPDDGGYKYDIQQIPVPGYPDIEASRVIWGEAVEGAARDLLAQAEETETPDERDERQSVGDFLQRELADGSRNAGDVIRAGESLGFNKRAIQRGTTKLRVIRAHESNLDGGWTWTLPSKMPTRTEGDEGDRSQNVAPSSPSHPSEPNDVALAALVRKVAAHQQVPADEIAEMLASAQANPQAAWTSFSATAAAAGIA